MIIFRYPLLLERLYKFTSGDNADKSAIMEAKLKIEDILDHINSVSVYDSHGTFHLIHMGSNDSHGTFEGIQM